VRADELRMSIPDAAVTVFATYGVVIVELPAPPTPEDLVSLEKSLGPLWRHARSEENGIAVIEASGGDTGFLGTMSDEHPPHTDGAYSPAGPAIVLLSCEHAEAIGGESVLVSAATVHNRLRAERPDLLAALYRPDAMTITRNGATARHPAFAEHDGLVCVRYRQDNHSSTESSCSQALAAMTEAVLDPANQFVTSLRRGDVLILDNRAVLHGRRAFDRISGRRRMLRLNFDGGGNQDLRFGFRPADQP
jgi:alpha-ketoglutarate-dependent taurine dioxygenase